MLQTFFSAKGSGRRKNERCGWLMFLLRQGGKSSVSGRQPEPWPCGTLFPGSSVKMRYLLLCTEAYFVAKSRG